jgi:hypothetical protein
MSFLFSEKSTKHEEAHIDIEKVFIRESHFFCCSLTHKVNDFFVFANQLGVGDGVIHNVGVPKVDLRCLVGGIIFEG